MEKLIEALERNSPQVFALLVETCREGAQADLLIGAALAVGTFILFLMVKRKVKPENPAAGFLVALVLLPAMFAGALLAQGTKNLLAPRACAVQKLMK